MENNLPYDFMIGDHNGKLFKRTESSDSIIDNL